MTTQIPRAVPAQLGPADERPDAERVVLRDGSVIAIRSLQAGDVAVIDSWFAGLGEDTRYARFLAGISRLDDRTRTRLAEVDHRDHEALTAVAANGDIAGIARYIRMPESQTAEVAVAVADRWRQRGIASLLLQRIAGRARTAGIGYLTAVCLRSNTAVLRLLARLGTMTTTASDEQTVEVRIEL